MKNKKSKSKKPYKTLPNPLIYGYVMQVDKKTKKKNITFIKDTSLPLEYVEDVVKECKEAKLKDKEIAVGFAILIPNISKILHKKDKGMNEVKRTTAMFHKFHKK